MGQGGPKWKQEIHSQDACIDPGALSRVCRESVHTCPPSPQPGDMSPFLCGVPPPPHTQDRSPRWVTHILSLEDSNCSA